MSFAILGLGTAVPKNAITQNDGMLLNKKLCCSTPEQEGWLPDLYKQSGIEKRHIVLERQVIEDVLKGTQLSQSVFVPRNKEDRSGPATLERMRHYQRYAGPLALEAAERALEQSRLLPRDITHLVTVSCTGLYAPGVDVHLFDGLGLPRSTQRTHVGFMGCHGALNGLRVAKAVTGSEPGARVLLCAVELCSLHYHYGWDPEKMVINAIFADGAGAVVGAADTCPEAWQLRASGSYVFPHSQKAMTWTVGDRGFQMTLSKQVPELIARHLRPWLLAWLDRQGMSLRDVASWAVHPGGPKILTLIEDSLELPASANQPAREILAEYGNMSSATILFLLDKLRRQSAPRPCLALAFGPGLTVEAALFQ